MKETDADHVVKGSTYLVTQSLVTNAIRAVALTFITRMLTQTEMGVIVVLSLVVSVAEVLSDLGLSRGLTRYIAEYRGRDKDYTLISFAGVLTKSWMTGPIAIVCVLAAPWLSNSLLRDPQYKFLFQLVSVSVLMFCLRVTVTSVLLGVDRTREIAILNAGSTVTRQMFAVGLLMYGLGLVGVIIGWILGGLAFMIPSTLIILKNKYVRKHQLKDVIPSLRMLARFSWPLFLTNIVLFVYNWFDQALLLVYIPLSEVAVYYIAIQAFNVLHLIPVAMSLNLLPYFSEQYGRDSQEKIASGLRGASRYISLLYTPLALGLAVTAYPVMRLFAGAAYASGGIILAVLCLLAAFTGIQAALGSLLLVYKMTPTYLLINVASIGASLVALPILLPPLGATGMAIIKGTALILSFVLSAIALRRRIRMEFDIQAMWKGWAAAILMFLTVFLAEHILFSPYLLPAYILVGGAAYAGSLKILKAVNKNDFNLIRNLMGKRVAPLVDFFERALV